MTAGPREASPVPLPVEAVAAEPALPPPAGLACAEAAAAAAPAARSRRGGKVLRVAVTLALVGAIFGFALPHLASYRSVWATIQAMSAGHVLLLAAATAASMITGWMAISAVLPALRLREAAVVNLGSSAVANTLPAGGALAMGVSWAMMSSWGVSAADYALYTLVSGIWNVFAKLSLPALAVLVLVTDGRPSAGLVAGAGAGLGLLAAAAAGFALLLRSEPVARRADRGLQFVVARCGRLARRRKPVQASGSVLRFRERAAEVLRARGWRITATTAATNLTLWLVLLACLRGAGLSQAQVSWQASLAAFAFVRLLTVLPVTPGGLGVTELGLVGVLADGASHPVTVKVIAAVLLFRALTYLLPIPLGAVAALAWQHAPGLSRGRRARDS
ncbi:MAG TPA: YbhN family protein [Streptosporangiaceae bacterium]|nr:YbhN family protein [Streptosporangiaceae bacterium]